MRGPTQPHQLHISCNRDAHIPRELAMKVERREIGDATERFDGQVSIEMGVDVGEDRFEAFGVGGVCGHDLDRAVIESSLRRAAARLAVFARLVAFLVFSLAQHRRNICGTKRQFSP